MPPIRCIENLKGRCLETLSRFYVGAIPAVIADGDISAARAATLDKLPRQILVELLHRMQISVPMKTLLRNYNCNEVIRFLLSPVIKSVCLIPFHAHEHALNCVHFSISLLPYDLQMELERKVDSESALRDLVSLGNSKLSSLHLSGLPNGICDMVPNFPNLKCLWIQNCDESGPEEDILERLLECLEKLPLVDEIHLLRFSLSCKTISTLRKMRYIRTLDLRMCDARCEDAALLLYELPNLVEFGWGDLPDALTQLVDNFKKGHKDLGSLKKLDKWFGTVSVVGLVRCGQPLFNLLNVDWRGFNYSFGKISEYTFINVEMEGKFGWISSLCQKWLHDYQLNAILSFNGVLITKLCITKGDLTARTASSIIGCCPNLEELFLGNSAILPIYESLQVFDTVDWEMTKLRKLEYSLTDETFPLFRIEMDWLGRVLLCAPHLETIIVVVDCSPNPPMDDTWLSRLLPERLESLEHFEFRGSYLHLSSLSIDRVLEMAPNLKHLGNISSWKNLSSEDVNVLKKLIAENSWNLDFTYNAVISSRNYIVYAEATESSISDHDSDDDENSPREYDNEGTSSYDDVEGTGRCDDFEGRDGCDDRKRRDSCDDIEGRRSCDNIGERGSCNDIEGIGSCDDIERRGSFDDTEGRSSCDDIEEIVSCDDVEQKGNYADVEGKGCYDGVEEEGNYDDFKGKGPHVDGRKGSYDDTERKRACDNVEEKGSYDDVEGKGSYDNVEGANLAMVMLKDKGSYDDVKRKDSYDDLEGKGIYDDAEKEVNCDDVQKKGSYDDGAEGKDSYDNVDEKSSYDTSKEKVAMMLKIKSSYSDVEEKGNYDYVEGKHCYGNVKGKGSYDDLEDKGSYDAVEGNLSCDDVEEKDSYDDDAEINDSYDNVEEKGNDDNVEGKGSYGVEDKK